MMNLKTSYFLLFCFLHIIAWSQNGTIKVTSFVYKDSLKLDFYKPVDLKQQEAPLIVLMHGGGFASGTRDGQLERKFCEKMAEMGYAVSSISYRLTRKGDPFNCDCDTEKKMFSFISASEDLSEAVHFLKARQELSFDRKKIILMGSSAGAEAVLHSAFMSHDYRFKHIKPFEISGVISFSGAVSNAAYIQKQNTVPTLLVHGKKDKLVPYGTAAHHYCPEDRSGYLMLDGPETIISKLGETGGSYILAYDPNGGHEWANEAYSRTDLVSWFIEDLVIEQKEIQETLAIFPEKKSADKN